ncbi:MAG: hypothetical protein Q8R44_02105 [Novosphingobium sp.]|nr:hypothetical protein [Novosphingobium sp.]
MKRSGRDEWRAAVHAALLAGAATLAPPVVAKSTPTPAFAPPGESPLLLSRKVVRELSGGAAIVATRRYRITFHPVADGWQVEGVLVGSEIDVPPALAAIAVLERDRPDDGLFPIHLDRSGRIVAAPAAPSLGREAVAGALGAAERFAGGGNAATTPGLLSQIGAAAASPGGGLTRWPEALFLPRGLSGTTEHAFRLPDGSEGSVLVSLESVPAPGLTTMGKAIRTVVTLAAGTRRVAREEWTLEAARISPHP